MILFDVMEDIKLILFIILVQELHLEKKLISGKAKHVPSVSKENTVSNGQDGWMEVGPKNKTSALRTVGFIDH